jgi:acyl-coenzyme A thioesterase PaaI-like protein
MTDEAGVGERPVSYVGALGVSVWHEGDRTEGSVDLHPSMWATGTTRPRVGVLAVLADFVISSPPTGVLVPTVDLRIELLDDLPSAGLMTATATMLKVGRRLALGEAWLAVDGVRCARVTGTFVTPAPGSDSLPASLAVAFPPGREMPARPESFDALIGATQSEPGTTVVDASAPIRNGPGGTVQGGIQATIAEIAAEAALGGSAAWAVHDIDVRYLGTVGAGPVVASAEVLANDGTDASVRVTLRDAAVADPTRLVAYVATRCHRV